MWENKGEGCFPHWKRISSSLVCLLSPPPPPLLRPISFPSFPQADAENSTSGRWNSTEKSPGSLTSIWCVSRGLYAFDQKGFETVASVPLSTSECPGGFISKKREHGVQISWLGPQTWKPCWLWMGCQWRPMERRPEVCTAPFMCPGAAQRHLMPDLCNSWLKLCPE